MTVETLPASNLKIVSASELARENKAAYELGGVEALNALRARRQAAKSRLAFTKDLGTSKLGDMEPEDAQIVRGLKAQEKVAAAQARGISPDVVLKAGIGSVLDIGPKAMDKILNAKSLKDAERELKSLSVARDQAQLAAVQVAAWEKKAKAEVEARRATPAKAASDYLSKLEKLIEAGDLEGARALKAAQGK